MSLKIASMVSLLSFSFPNCAAHSKRALIILIFRVKILKGAPYVLFLIFHEDSKKHTFFQDLRLYAHPVSILLFF